jgi:hypothetical protein
MMLRNSRRINPISSKFGMKEVIVTIIFLSLLSLVMDFKGLRTLKLLRELRLNEASSSSGGLIIETKEKMIIAKSKMFQLDRK